MTIINKYLEQIKLEEEFHDNSVVTYKRKVEVFFEYLEYEKLYQNDDTSLGLINEEQILNSIKYYKNKYDINFRATIECYMVVIIDFFKFLSFKCSIINTLFDSKASLTKLNKEIEKLFVNLKLKKTKQKDIINEKSYNKILCECNSRIDTPSIREVINDSKEYTKFTSSIIIKLVMFVGVKNKVISNLKTDAIDLDKNTILINNFKITLTEKYQKQLEKYLGVRNQVITSNSNNKNLFIQIDGRPIGTNNTLMYATLEAVFKKRIGESVAKYVVVKMIEKGMNAGLIKKLTGFGLPTYQHCQEVLNDRRSFNDTNIMLDECIKLINSANFD